MKKIIILVLFYFGGCCHSKDILTSFTTERDTSIQPSVVHDSILVFNEDYGQELNDQINQLYQEIERLQGRKPDTVLITKFLNGQSFKHQWSGFKVTQRGDSIWVTFKYDNGNGTFTFKEIPVKINVTITDTHTTAIKQYDPTWYEKLWNDFKDVILIAFTLIIGAGALYAFVIKKFKE